MATTYYLDDNETERELYLALAGLDIAVKANVPGWADIAELKNAVWAANEALGNTEQPEGIQLWQHATSGEVYAVEVGLDDGWVRRAAGPLHHDDFKAAFRGDVEWATEEDGLAEDINADRDSYRLKEVPDDWE